MKGFLPFLALVIGLQLSACGGEESQTPSDADSTAVDGAAAAIADEDLALSTWEGQSVRTAPGSGGEWVATLPFGEKLELLGETQTDEKTKKSYAKVRLLDGKDGWVREDMIQAGGVLGAITETAQVYSRPGISNIKDETLEPTSLVVLTTKQDDFIEFTAQNKGNTRSKGWMLGDRSYTDAGRYHRRHPPAQGPGRQEPRKQGQAPRRHPPQQRLQRIGLPERDRRPPQRGANGRGTCG